MMMINLWIKIQPPLEYTNAHAYDTYQHVMLLYIIYGNIPKKNYDINRKTNFVHNIEYNIQYRV